MGDETTTQYGPKACVECGTPAKVGQVWPVFLDVDGTQRRVPGLYRCPGCQELLNGGLIRSNIGHEEAFNFLAGLFIPKAATKLMFGMVPEGIRAATEALLAKSVDLASDLAKMLPAPAEGGDGEAPAKQVTVGGEDFPREVALAYVAAGADTIRANDAGETVFTCPGCDREHPVEQLFEILDKIGPDAA